MSLLGSAAASFSVPPAPPSHVACAVDADAARGRPGEEPAEPHCHLLSDGTLVCHSAVVVCGSIGGIGGRPGLTTCGNCRFYIYSGNRLDGTL